jgi:hypothetical protein
LAAEVATLRAQVAQLHLQQRHREELHQAELAAVLEDTAAHEVAAVAQAVATERLNCVYRFAAFLQARGGLTDGVTTRVIVHGVSCFAVCLTESPVSALLQNNNLATELLASHGLVPGSSSAGSAARPSPATPSGSLDFLGFPPLDRRSTTAVGCAPATPGLMLGVTAVSRPSNDIATPFCFSDLEQRLRTEFSGDISRFMVPAADVQTPSTTPIIGSF